MGAVYTPAALARWTAALLVETSITPIRSLLDPACGDGALLDAARLEMPSLTQLVGFDLSETAMQAARANLGPDAAALDLRDALEAVRCETPGVDAVLMNPPWGADMSAQASALRELGYTLARGQFDSWDLFVEWSIRVHAAGTVVAAFCRTHCSCPSTAQQDGFCLTTLTRRCRSAG